MTAQAIRTIAFLGYLIAVVPSNAVAQPAAAPVVMELVLRDDTTLFGYVQEDGPDKVVFKTVGGEIRTVERGDVASLLPIVGRDRDGAFWRVDPFESRLFFASTGRALRKKHGYAGAFGAAFAPFVQAAPAERVSVGAGFGFFFTPVVLSAKVQVVRGRFNNAAVGVLHVESPLNSSRFGVVYAVDTIGTEDLGVTIGVGRGYRSETGSAQVHQSNRGNFSSFSSGSTSTIWLAGVDYRVAPRLKFLTEHYFAKDGGMHMFGIRIISDVVGVDLGIVRFDSKTDFSFLPVVNVCWKIGR